MASTLWVCWPHCVALPARRMTSRRCASVPCRGLHVWHRNDGGHHWQCSSGSGGGRALAWQVDVRAHGGYIVAPGTVTSAGVYRPVGTVRVPAPLPAWLARELERTGHLPSASVPGAQPVPPRARQAARGGWRTRCGGAGADRGTRRGRRMRVRTRRRRVLRKAEPGRVHRRRPGRGMSSRGT